MVLSRELWEFKDGRKEKEGHKILKRVVSIILAVLLVVVNIACYKFENILTLFLGNPEITDEATLAAANENAENVTKEIERERIVLPKNTDKTLPLSDKNVNVFGWGSVSPIYAGTGFGGGNEGENTTVQKGLENAGFTSVWGQYGSVLG